MINNSMNNEKDPGGNSVSDKEQSAFKGIELVKLAILIHIDKRAIWLTSREKMRVGRDNIQWVPFSKIYIVV